MRCASKILVKRSGLIWLIFAAFAILAFYEANKLPFGRVSAPAAGFFPTVLATVLAAIALIGIFATLRSHGSPESVPSQLTWGKILLTVAVLLAFAAVFEFAGYLLTTFLFVMYLLRAVERKSWTQAGVVALSASVVSYIVFGLLLGAPLPAGFLRL
jgi:putative tricarboxylic transport membrane protein